MFATLRLPSSFTIGTIEPHFMPNFSQASRNSRSTSPLPSFQGEFFTEYSVVAVATSRNHRDACCNQDHFETTFLQSLYPLFAIEFRRIEKYRTVLPVTPLITGKGVDTEVLESCEFQLLPLQLLWSRKQKRHHIVFCLDWVQPYNKAMSSKY